MTINNIDEDGIYLICSSVYSINYGKRYQHKICINNEIAYTDWIENVHVVTRVFALRVGYSISSFVTVDSVFDSYNDGRTAWLAAIKLREI